MQLCLCDGRNMSDVEPPSQLLSALRNGAGMDTRPLASSLLIWVPTNWVIRPGPPFPLRLFQIRRTMGPLPSPLRMAMGQPHHPLGEHGITWDFVVVKGILRFDLLRTALILSYGQCVRLANDVLGRQQLR